MHGPVDMLLVSKYSLSLTPSPSSWEEYTSLPTLGLAMSPALATKILVDTMWAEALIVLAEFGSCIFFMHPPWKEHIPGSLFSLSPNARPRDQTQFWLPASGHSWLTPLEFSWSQQSLKSDVWMKNKCLLFKSLRLLELICSITMERADESTSEISPETSQMRWEIVALILE